MTQNISSTHPHQHTKHTLIDVIEALPRYDVLTEYDGYMVMLDDGPYLKRADVLVVVKKAATLGAPVDQDVSQDEIDAEGKPTMNPHPSPDGLWR